MSEIAVTSCLIYLGLMASPVPRDIFAILVAITMTLSNDVTPKIKMQVLFSYAHLKCLSGKGMLIKELSGDYSTYEIYLGLSSKDYICMKRFRNEPFLDATVEINHGMRALMN